MNKQTNKKGQAALEFLTTYGWAFLVILVMIGALAYFGVLDPSRFLPERCQFQSGISCGRFLVSGTGTTNIELTNNMGKVLHIRSGVAGTSAQWSVDGTWPVANTCTVSGGGTVWASTQTITLNCAASASIQSGMKQKLQVRIFYSEGGTGYVADWGKTIEGEVYGQAQ